ncbi:integrase core domain-containing protein [Lentzea sp. NPDC059081]|uniref:integrase core domain-containing protein n=1 Tax=Lentzea sp. NPDC059081 TaxID=3346719 RepID=UPI003697A4B4
MANGSSAASAARFSTTSSPWGEGHARQVLAAYQTHYNEHRPHQARDQLLPDAHEHLRAAHDLDVSGRRPVRTRILGGVIAEYRYAA